MNTNTNNVAEILSDIENDEGPDDYSLPLEEFLDRNFGRGTWVLDPYSDKFVVWDVSHRGPEKSYIVIDRDFRRYVNTIPASHIN